MCEIIDLVICSSLNIFLLFASWGARLDNWFDVNEWINGVCEILVL